MTYCVAISVNAGICFISDSRTNAGVDQVSTYSKVHVFGRDGDRQIVLLSAGNLATTQGVINQLEKDIKTSTRRNLMTVTTMLDAADYVGEVSVAQQEKHTASGASYEASFLVAGQIMGEEHRCFMIYPQGNHITTSADTPFLQIGESKYGKPILDRIIDLDLALDTAAVCGLVSMDSTMKSNVTVGPPIDVLIYEAETLVLNKRYRFDESSEYLRQINAAWDQRLKEAFASMPPISWSENWDASADGGQ